MEDAAADPEHSGPRSGSPSSQKGRFEFEWDWSPDDAVGECLCSPPFQGERSDEGPAWRLQVYPGGHSALFKDHVSVFLQPLCNDQGGSDAHFAVSLYAGDQLLQRRVKVAEMSASRPSGWFRFLDRARLEPSLTEWLASFVAPSRAKRLKLVCDYVLHTHCETMARSPNGSGDDDGELARDLQSLRRSGYRSDAALWVGNQEIQVHKLVLSARSPVFRCLFGEPGPDELFVADASYASCQSLVAFLYSGQVAPLTPPSAVALYALARRYAVHALTERCVRFLESHCEVRNVAEVLVFAERWRESGLKGRAMDFVKANYAAVSKTPGWETALQSHPDLEKEVLRHLVAH